MINRYQGNSGRFTRVEEGHKSVRSADENRTAHSREGPGRQPHHTRQQHGGILEKLSGLIPGGISPLSQLTQLETEDVILLLILYLMYRESGDSELLMIMGAMFLM